MKTQPDPKSLVVFGPFEYDELSGQLRKHGNLLRLQGQPLQILSVLVNRPRQIISRDELRHHFCGGTTFGDFEQGLNSAVNKLRQTLGDSSEQPRYIETVPGRGYRFVALVQPASARAVLEMAAPAPLRVEASAKTRPQRRVRVTVNAAVALA